MGYQDVKSGADRSKQEIFQCLPPSPWLLCSYIGSGRYLASIKVHFMQLDKMCLFDEFVAEYTKEEHWLKGYGYARW